MADADLKLLQTMTQNMLDQTRLIRADLAELKAGQATMLELLASHNRRLVTVEDRLERVERRLELA